MKVKRIEEGGWSKAEEEMLHKWKRKRYQKKLYEMKDDTVETLDYRIKIADTYECINCGLRKGTTRNLGFYPVSVYFNEDGIISTHTIPYACQGIKGGAYFNEDEFKII